MKVNLVFIIALCSSVLNGQKIQQELGEIITAKQNRLELQSLLSPDLYAMLAAQSPENKELLKGVVSAKEIKMYATGHPDKLQLNSRSKQRLYIELFANNVDALTTDLEGLGFEEITSSQKYNRIVGYLHIDQLLALEKLRTKGLTYVQEVLPAQLRVGSVTSQADDVMGTAKIRELDSDLDGTGVKIGVLSDSYNFLGGAAAGVASQDLPIVTVVEEGGTSDEGRAMVELIHDMAPGAEILFATANGGELNFANNIDTLAKLGCKIIVDDIFYFAEPIFQDGIIAQKIDEVTEEYGVSYFSAAGNQADDSYESTDINLVGPLSIGPVNYDIYDFDPGPDTALFNAFTLDSGQIFNLFLQWDDPFFNAVQSDLDFFIFDADDTSLVASSFDDNILSDFPVEAVVGFQNNKPNHTYLLVVGLFTGPVPSRIKLIDFAGVIDFEFSTNSPTIFGHPAARSCIAVGAMPFFALTPEPFTSLGPSTILFEADGTRKLGPEVRNKPEITGIDGVNNTFFGELLDDGDLFPNFFGTSAAAPNAAALASLICQVHPTATPQDIKEILIRGAFDFADPGFDFLTGHGLVTALASCIIKDLIADQALIDDGLTFSPVRGIETVTIDANSINFPNFFFDFVAGEEVVMLPDLSIFSPMEINIEKCIE